MKQMEVSRRSFRAAFEGEEQDQHGAKCPCDTESCESSTEIILHGPVFNSGRDKDFDATF